MSSKKAAASNGKAESIEFSAEISKVLQLMIHSLYTNKDIFLRELISNASDACDKLRYQAVQNDALLDGDAELKIRIAADKDNKTIRVGDNGIGMNRDDLIANLGTIAKSGTQEFIQSLTGDNKKDVSLIGQFGVGFYSAFMVADKVEVRTRKAGEDTGWLWVSEGDGQFTIQPMEDVNRGTEITLHVNDDAKEYLDAFKLKFIAQTYSDHISFPIMLEDAEGNEEKVNEGSAIWARPKSDITDEQYKEFYHHVAHQPDEPWLTLHNKAEGVVEYTNLLYVPSMKPFDLFNPERRRRVKLYVKRVFISDEGVDLVPHYLRFLRGVVDSQDLPLNISRETLQDNPVLKKIRDAITKKVLNELKKKAAKDSEDYLSFWNNFGAVLKEGLCEHDTPRDLLFDACRFYSSHDESAPISLESYVERMKEGQEHIYYINGDNLDALRHSPQIEGFKKKGIEVLFFTDHVDDFWVNVANKYKDIGFKSVLRAGNDLDTLEGESASDEETKEETPSADMDALITFMKETLGDMVRDVRTTSKLAESPVCLAVNEGDMDPRMERFLLEHKQLPKGTAKILEINPSHPIITSLAKQLGNDGQQEDAKDAVHLLFDQARIIEGEAIEDPSNFARRMSAFMARGLAA
ncbi:MAG: molecular chaperone HtpG [Rickettsiales bacterium]|nr:molecular chaperone HtpG [Rickettsiales bacterium]